VAADPSRLEALVGAGNVLLALGEPGEAERMYRRALHLQADHYAARLGLAHARLQQNDLPEAEQLYRLLAADERTTADLHFNLAMIVARQGRLAEAQADLQAADRRVDRQNDAALAESISRELVVVHNALGAQLQSKGRLDEAVRQFNAAVERDPSFAPGYFNRALALEQLGRTDAAVENLEMALRLVPGKSEPARAIRESLNRIRKR
jgi:tetratricopeptide (TPR) repeat protein